MSTLSLSAEEKEQRLSEMREARTESLRKHVRESVKANIMGLILGSDMIDIGLKIARKPIVLEEVKKVLEEFDAMEDTLREFDTD